MDFRRPALDHPDLHIHRASQCFLLLRILKTQRQIRAERVLLYYYYYYYYYDDDDDDDNDYYYY